jgi:hypothetical protein
MSFNVTGLTNYTNEQSTDLLVKALFSGKTAKLLYDAGQVQVGVKSAAALNILSSDVYFQSDSCGYSPSGVTNFTQRVITVGKIKVEETLCPKTLEAKWMQTQIAPGSPTAVPFEEQIGMEKSKNIAEKLEIAMWQGTTATANTNPNTNKFDGLLKVITDSAAFVSGNTGSVTAVTSTNIGTILDAIYAAVPARIADKDNIKLFMGVDNFKLALVNLKNANLYHYVADATSELKMIWPGTNVEIIGVGGLNGTNKMVCTNLDNLFVGTDLAHEEEDAKIWYSMDTDEVRFRLTMKYGTQIAFPDQVVYFTL